MLVRYQNPTLVPFLAPFETWETVVDVVDDYFPIAREEPVRHIGDVLVEGRLDTRPVVGATLLEPWRRDSADMRERLESTLQTIRRHATVRVIPAQGGYWVEVIVYKELEDVVQPEQSTAGAATLSYDPPLTKITNPIIETPVDDGWIPLGRDPVLEQRILRHLVGRFGGEPPMQCGTTPTRR